MTIDIQRSFATNTNLNPYGTLYLVATPIGNLEDMTFRAVRILKEVSLIAAEDTRQTRKLLTHFGISTKLVSYYMQNQESSGLKIIEKLKSGNDVALVSDAGMPMISDPGYELVRQALDERISIVPVPGANAALTALIASGLPTFRFLFLGFLPRTTNSLVQQLQALQQASNTLIFYESPHRIAKTLKVIQDVYGEHRQLCLARELTKKYEEFVRGNVAECIAHVSMHPPKGEYCVVLEGNTALIPTDQNPWWHQVSIEEHVQHYMASGEMKKEAIKRVAKDRNLPKRDIYRMQIDSENK